MSSGRVLCFRCQARCNDLENGRSLPSNDFPIQNIGFSFSFTPSLVLPFLLHSSLRSSPPPDGLDKSLSFLLARCTWQDWQWSAELIRSPDFKMPFGRRLNRPCSVNQWMDDHWCQQNFGAVTDFRPMIISLLKKNRSMANMGLHIKNYSWRNTIHGRGREIMTDGG